MTTKVTHDMLTAGLVSVTELADGALTADATGRAKMADAFLSADATGRAKMADGFLTADAAGRAKMADGFINLAKLGLLMGSGAGAQTPIGVANVNTTVVGNVGAGTDDLMTYSLPADSLSAARKGIRITVWGKYTNNANSKALTLMFGSQQIVLASLLGTTGGKWRIQSTVISTGANAQNCDYLYFGITSTLSATIDTGSLAAVQTTGSAITIKCTGAGVADNDITQEGMLVEFMN